LPAFFLPFASSQIAVMPLGAWLLLRSSARLPLCPLPGAPPSLPFSALSSLLLYAACRRCFVLYRCWIVPPFIRCSFLFLYYYFIAVPLVY
jgi:hypothetical protein